MRQRLLATAGALALALAAAAPGPARAADDWLAKAAAPFKGTQLNVIFLDRPGYRAIEKLLPEFE
ncbi:MAG: sugar ABC transporter substrate-binding protein, partial [Alphaproteobacteria bacterium]|nr:sugar ABC transporter substrate-binding protein [Alphaproteobacteria bacterium]